jgi:hypothetical protein
MAEEHKNVSTTGLEKLEALFKEAGLSAEDAKIAMEKLNPVLVDEADNFSKSATYVNYDRVAVNCAFSATGTDIGTTGVSMGTTGASIDIIGGEAGLKCAIADLVLVGFSNGGGKFEMQGLIGEN